MPVSDLIRPNQDKNYWAPAITNDLYHSDKSAVSSTSLKHILKSDKAFHGAFYGAHKEPSTAMIQGTLVHAAVLEKKDPRSMYKFRNNKTDQKIYDNVCGMTEAVSKHAMATTLLSGGFVERTGYYCDPDTGIHCKIRPDLYNPEIRVLVDVKTSSNVSEREFQSQLWSFRYDLSLAMYAEGIKLIDGQYPDNIVIVAIENTFPFEICIYDLTSMLKVGRAEHDYRRALKRLRKAIEANTWADREQDITPISYPFWIENKPLDEE